MKANDNDNQKGTPFKTGTNGQALFLHGQALVNSGQPTEALDYFRRAATQGHIFAEMEAARVLMYLVETPAALSEAIDRLQRAESAGVVGADYHLALLALGNLAIPRDLQQIDARILASAHSSYLPAMRAAGLLLARGSAAADLAISTQWLSRAAKSGDLVSALLLAERLRHGIGISADTVAAANLDRQLAQAGHMSLPKTSATFFAQSSADETSDSTSWSKRFLKLPAAISLCDNPQVRLFESLLSNEECRFIIAMARPLLKRSRVFDPNSAAAKPLAIRTSSDTSFDPMQEDFILRLLQLRIAQAGGCELVQGEHLIVLRYQPQEQYLPHRDYLSPKALAALRPSAGQRRTTVCVYLNEVENGGETEFPLLGVRVAPKLGAALVFENLGPDGSPEPRSLHAGLPVTTGEKWLATLWLRQFPFRHY